MSNRWKNGRKLNLKFKSSNTHNASDNWVPRTSSFRNNGFSEHRRTNKNIVFKHPFNNRGGYHIKKNWIHSKTGLYNHQHKKFLRKNEMLEHNGNQRSHFIRNSISVTKSSIPLHVLNQSHTGWYSVHIPNIHDSAETLKKIQTYIAPFKLFPFNEHFSENNLRFYIDNIETANILNNITCKLRSSEGRKLVIHVNTYAPTRQTIFHALVSNKMKEKMCETIRSRYNPSTKSLDLCRFHATLLLTEHHLYCPLNWPSFLLTVLHLGAQFTKHDLYGLSLEYNNIYLGEGLVWIRRLFPDLKILNLTGNKLKEFKDLKELSGYKIEELNLSKNPINAIEDKQFYIEKLQHLFPMLVKLDGIDLPCRYTTISNTKFKMPINMGNSYPIEQGNNPEDPNTIIILAESFVAQYYEHYDTGMSKCQLVDAYHENSTFTLSAFIHSNNKTNNLRYYLSESRNLLKKTEIMKYKRSHFYHRGKENILKALDKLPKMKHDIKSFTIDVPLANSSMVQIVVNGVFSEYYYNNSKPLFRSFCRTFNVIPTGDGCWRILNDMFCVTTANNESIIETTKHIMAEENLKSVQSINLLNYNGEPLQMEYKTTTETLLQSTPKCTANIQQQNSFSANQPTNGQTSQIIYQQMPQNHISEKINTPTYISNLLSQVNETNNSLEEKLVIIKQFSIESGMNEEWAKKCLEENNWDYAKAANCFLKLKPNIPSAAFLH
ncbi:nuclear RNA export factor 1-like isoform X2 [Daktulosphaira vitifoliae]|uniref:nuclear RNA export factor 1-like isoform X2 n=1 Tax=Daktulosphaira vitifoliae TaxID=58002 RepID=UPI0021AB076B|nr:nuclear RNA export factor 1-like isoform X2 [Daktulosphaira vitifoliae]